VTSVVPVGTEQDLGLFLEPNPPRPLAAAYLDARYPAALPDHLQEIESSAERVGEHRRECDGRAALRLDQETEAM